MTGGLGRRLMMGLGQGLSQGGAAYYQNALAEEQRRKAAQQRTEDVDLRRATTLGSLLSSHIYPQGAAVPAGRTAVGPVDMPGFGRMQITSETPKPSTVPALGRDFPNTPEGLKSSLDWRREVEAVRPPPQPIVITPGEQRSAARYTREQAEERAKNLIASGAAAHEVLAQLDSNPDLKGVLSAPDVVGLWFRHSPKASTEKPKEPSADEQMKQLVADRIRVAMEGKKPQADQRPGEKKPGLLARAVGKVYGRPQGTADDSPEKLRQDMRARGMSPEQIDSLFGEWGLR